ncbi:MAG: hypothetical protein DLM63_05190 [Solirubrobacterales bacterium]|nr:MAG: hypothetical protein DLM63_05190 [Solirubrobacterales bacterium]
MEFPSEEALMAIGTVQEFEGFDTEIYDAVCQKVNFPDDWPDGLLYHAAGPAESGGMRITDQWQSAEQFQRFMETKIQPAVQEVFSERGTEPAGPPKTTIFEIHSTAHTHA